METVTTVDSRPGTVASKGPVKTPDVEDLNKALESPLRVQSETIRLTTYTQCQGPRYSKGSLYNLGAVLMVTEA